MKAIFVHKSDNRVSDILPWVHRGGITPMQGYYVFLTEKDVSVGDDWSKQVREAQEKYPDTTHEGEDGKEYVVYGKYSPHALCREPWEVV